MSLLLERPTTTPTIESTRTVPSPHPAIVQPVEPWSCIYVTSISHRRVMAATAYDCVRFVVVRDGSLILTDAGSGCSAAVGDVVLLAPNAEFGYEPEGIVTLTTLAVDTDYLIEQLFWQHLDVLADREAARDLAARLYPDPLQMLRLGESQAERLGSMLDELAILTEEDQSQRGYFRAHALLFTVLAALAPLVRHAPVTLPPLTSRQRAVRVAPPRWREFKPVRREIVRTAALMQSNLARQWPLPVLAAHACLSPSQLNRVFRDSFGVTPLVYLSILRVQEMARLIRETDLLIGTISERVGWCHHCHASRIFRRYMGVTPIEYRRYGPPTASREGPGIGVAAVRGNGCAPTY